ncbi:polymorphic toxin-type HINT domain-containing protein [Microbacterium thalassium]|uniref:polymorphic toxin-type HINT domain-containing protein n=1 Tax=Microbacterium TaxID=33882 RepID=UPI00146A6B24|nr:polymorphic toxin-type HINT domain-containing protein [Microbacterium thalassium]
MSTAVIAAALTAVLVVDPFGLSVVATHATTQSPAETREQNFADLLAAGSTQPIKPASPIGGSWPAAEPESAALQPAVPPVADEATVEVSIGADSTVDLGGMSVSVTAAEGDVAPDAVTLSVQDAAQTRAAGVAGVLLEVTEPAAGEPTADPHVQLSVSYAEFAGLYGGDWASRLRLVRLPDCRIDTPTAPECQPELIPSVNDPVAQTVSGVVPVDPAEVVMGSQGMALQTAALSGGSTLAVTAGVSGSAGDWSQTSLPLSSTWGTSGNTGAFTWSYPLTVPTSMSGLAPNLTLSYSSAVSDGRVPSSNNQAGWIGEGFDLTSSYIERQYKPCADDTAGSPNNAGRDTGDLCWGPVNASMVFNGAGSTLVKDSGNRWRNKTDDGTRIELLTGGWNGIGDREYWKVTTTDGTQYFFGRGKAAENAPESLNSAWKVPVYGNHAGEKCYKAADDGGFASSRCDQVWRWNLDYVVDPSGNTMTYEYATESNAYVNDYGHNTDWTPISYTSGGRLTQIEYGTREGSTIAAPYRIVFDAEKRCVTDRADGLSLCKNGQNETDKTKWVDTPTDLQCATSADECPNVVPVFFDTTRLAKITTQARSGADYLNVDAWVFGQRFHGEGDNGQIGQAANITLRLDSVNRTGFGANTTPGDDITLPAVQFTYEPMANRVDNGTDGHSALFRDRIIGVRTESGGAVSVAYREPDCADGAVPIDDSAHDQLCYLVKWQPEGEFAPQEHWFHKYVVEAITEDGAPAASGGNQLTTGSASKVTRYRYEDAAWAKPQGWGIKATESTFSEFRGFRDVYTTVGQGDDAATTDHTTYFRGVEGPPLKAGPAGHVVEVPDLEAYAGQVFNSQTLNGTTKTSETINRPGDPIEIVTQQNLTSIRVPSATTHGFTYDAEGALSHRTSTTTTFDEHGLPITVNDRGNLTTTADDVCTKTSYRRDGIFTGAHKMSYAEKTEVYASACDGTLSNATLISRDTALYDDFGRVVETKAVHPDDASADVTESKTTYDDLGRVKTVEDADGNVTTTTYTTGPGGQLASTTTTSPDPDGLGGTEPFTSTQTFNPLTGLPVSTTDQNGLTTEGTYDALGRPTSLRYPQHKDAPHPSVEYAYSDPSNGLNAVLTRTLAADGRSQHTSVVLYDGLGRPFQQQTEAANSTPSAPARMVSHVFYNSAGQTITQIAPWPVAGAPTMVAENPDPAPVAQTTYMYDKAGRVTDEVLWSGTSSNPDHEKWRTTTVYDGAVTLVIPPLGGTPTEKVLDARGRTVELREYYRDAQIHSAAVSASAVRGLVKQTTKYSYDAAGQLVKMTDPKSNEWTYTYDLAGQQTSATDPDGGTTTTSYYPLGQVKTSTNANGATLAYTYDRLGRPASLRDGDPNGNIRATWSYDTGTLPNGNQALGQLAAATRVIDGNEYVTSYPAYDTAYRPTQVDTQLPGNDALFSLAGTTFSTSYAYTADGQVRQVTYPKVTNQDGDAVLGAETVTTRFNANSRPSSMGGGFGWGIYVAASNWNPDGSLYGYDLGNTYGTSVAYDWDQVTGQLVGTRMARTGHGDGTELNLSYRYDPAGNVTSLIDAPTNTATVAEKDAQCFQYDGLQRLQVAWTDAQGDCARSTVTTADLGGVAPYWTEYAYDALGNRFSKTDHTAAATTLTEYAHGEGSAGPHQLTSMTRTSGSTSVTTGFTWDAAGNQTGRTVDAQQQTQTWDAEGELTAVTGGGADVSNIYDANGTRLIRIDDTGATVFLPGGQEVRATTETVTATRWYSFAGRTVATRTGKGLSGVSTIVTDAHGTPLASVHNTNWTAAVQRIRTDPFGAARAGQSGAVAGRGFLGAPTDTTGFTLLGARYYDPATGTFLSVDPELTPSAPAQFNAYVYSGNNPVTWADPTGRNWLGDAWKNVTGFVKKHQAEIGGFVAGALVTTGCLAATAGAGSVGCFIAGGAVAGAVTNVWKQSQSRKKFDWGSFARDTLTGGALGALGPVAGSLGRAVAPAASRFISAVGNALKPAAAKLPTAFKPAAAAASRPAASSARPAASAAAPKPQQSAASCAINSFVPGTLVLLADGSKAAIETLRLGDKVLATDPTTGETSAQPVLATITGTGPKDLVTLTVTTDTGDTGKVTATAGHPFWVPDRAEWVDAGDLAPGDSLLTSVGAWVQLTAVEHERREQTVHNLTVKSAHTYNVVAGKADVLTHNCATGMAGVRATGQVGETMAGIVKNTARIPSASGRAAYRIPDELNSSVLGEVKNVGRLNYTSQLRDFAAYARQEGLAFTLYTRGSTTFSSTLQAEITSGRILLDTIRLGL